MYHPSQAQGDVEYIELYNDTPLTVDVGGWYFSSGVGYTFPPNTTIWSHGYLVVCSNPPAFRLLYPSLFPLGPYSGHLNNAGEKIELRDAAGGLVDTVDYKDHEPWPVAADGTGHSLSLIHPYADNDVAESWTISPATGGTPGAANFAGQPPPSTVIINEIQVNPRSGQPWVELFNPTTNTAILSGYSLSDDANALSKYPLPTGTSLLPGTYGTFTVPSLPRTSGTVYLSDPTRTRVVDAAKYEGTAVGHSRGRFFDRRNHKEHWYYMTTPTPSGPNFVLLNDKIVINEIMYHPFPGHQNQEYVELYNRSPGSVNLTGWRFTGGIEYDFPSGTTLASDGYLVVAASTATIVSVYGLPPGQVLGGFRGKLNHDHDHIILRDNYGNIVDEVKYYDGGRWPEWADGLGASLELIDPNQSNDYPSAWAASDDSSKSLWTFVQYTKPQVPAGTPFENEFQMMLTDSGVALVDDLHMTTAGASQDLLFNGDFETSPSGWKVLGTHKLSSVVSGAGNAHGGSQALQVVATGRGTEGDNHIERDTSSPLVAGADYTISYWAKWTVGCNQLLTRTHYHGVAQTTPIPVPARLGTPGRRNSRRQPNLGPIIADVHHAPVTPKSSQQVTVTALVLDSDGVANISLYYKGDLAAVWQSIPMFDDGANGDGQLGDNVYGARIPPQPDGTLIEFYILAQDSADAWLTFPASDPPASPPPRCALCLVRNAPRTTTLKSFQLLVGDDVTTKLTTRSRMDNDLLDATFVLDDSRSFYNVGFRYKGSPFTRPSGWGVRPSYRIRFNSDEPFFGLVSVDIDSLNAINECRVNDILVQWLNYTIGVPTYTHEYVRMSRFCSLDPTPDRDHGVYDHMKRVDGAFIDDHFPDGKDGFLHKVDDHVEWNDGGGFTIRVPDDTAHLQYSGPDKEKYRWNFKPRSRELEDDFTSVIALTKFMDPTQTDDASFTANVENVIEVHEWLKKLAVSAVTVDLDTLGMVGTHGKNCYLYQRSDTGRWVLIPWDSDMTFLYWNRTVVPTIPWFDAERRLLNHPVYGRWYLRYIQQLVDGPFNAVRFNAKVSELYAVLQAENDMRAIPSCGPTRFSDFQASRVLWLTRNVLPGPVPFEITTNNGADFVVDMPTVTLQGVGGLEIFSFRVNGTPTGSSTWLDNRTWQISGIPLDFGVNPLVVTVAITRFPSLHTLPYGTSFEPTEWPAFRLGPLPQNYWRGIGSIQNTRVSEGVQAVGLQDGWTEHDFLAQGQNIVWLDASVCTEGTTETPSIPDGVGPFASQVFFSKTQGIQALNGDGLGGGTWLNSGVALDPNRFIRIATRLDFSAQRWDLYVNGGLVFTNLGFAHAIASFNRFRYYSDVSGALDQVLVTTGTAQCPTPNLAFEPPYTRGTTNTVGWGSVTRAAGYYLEWSLDSSFIPAAGNSGWTAATSYLATGLADGELYYYRVKCRNAALAESNWSTPANSRQDASPPATMALPLPALETFVAFPIAWIGDDAISGLASVKLFYRRGITGPFVQYGSVFTESPIIFDSSQTGGSGDYSFYTIGTDNVGNQESAPSTPDALTTVITAPPPAPYVLPEPPYSRGTGNTISWAPPPGAVGSLLQWATNPTFVDIAGYSGWVSGSSYGAANLRDGQMYYYRVKCRNAALLESGWSNVVNSTQDASPPTIPGKPLDTGVFTSSTSVTFYWTGSSDAVSGLASYELQVGTASGGSNVFAANVGNTLTKTITASNGQTLYARVRALDAVGNPSPWSAGSDGITVDTAGPRLLSVTVRDLRTLCVYFNEPVRNADQVSCYSCTRGLRILAVTPLTGSQYVLDTSDQVEGAVYTLTVARTVSDRAGNLLDPAYQSRSFLGGGQTGSKSWHLYR
jgi:hypothetical protein